MTTLTVNPLTIERLKKVGRFGESYNVLINRILDENEELK